jgi:hypothetical protein
VVIHSLDSYDYIQSLHQLQHGEALTDIDRFLLFTCWEYIPFATANSRYSISTLNINQIIEHVYDNLLTRLERALDEPPPIAPPSLAYIFQRCYQLLSIDNLGSFDKHAHYIIDHLTKMLQKPVSTITNDDDEALINVALEAFSNLSKNSNIRLIMKKRQLTPLFMQYTPPEMGEKRKLAFAILAQIMNEQEIKDNPAAMTGVFIDQLKQLDPKKYNPDLDSPLSSVKGSFDISFIFSDSENIFCIFYHNYILELFLYFVALMQHDQIKHEFIKQNGLETLVAFVRDGDPRKQSEEQLEDALEILWSCVLNNPQASTTLQQDVKLMTRVKDLLEHARQSRNLGLEKAAEGFIWKVEKEEKFKEQQAIEAEHRKLEKQRKAKESGKEEEDDESEEEQYDLMISYSWADMDLAHRIFNHLTKNLGYKIWLDQEQMHGSTIEAMVCQYMI